MANVPYVSTIQEDGRTLFICVTSATVADDGFKGCNWYLYNEAGKTVSYGYSRGWDQQGGGSALYAMKYGRRAAKRYLARELAQKILASEKNM